MAVGSSLFSFAHNNFSYFLFLTRNSFPFTNNFYIHIDSFSYVIMFSFIGRSYGCVGSIGFHREVCPVFLLIYWTFLLGGGI